MGIVKRLGRFVGDHPIVVAAGALVVAYTVGAGYIGYVDGTKILNSTYAKIVYDPNRGSTFNMEGVEKFLSSNNYNLTQFAIRKLEAVDSYHIINLNGGK